MSAVLHIDSGVMCNHKGCYDMIYASQLNLADRASAAVVRAELRERGWQTRRRGPTRKTGPPRRA